MPKAFDKASEKADRVSKETFLASEGKKGRGRKEKGGGGGGRKPSASPSMVAEELGRFLRSIQLLVVSFKLLVCYYLAYINDSLYFI
jgi:hypothetical protein